MTTADNGGGGDGVKKRDKNKSSGRDVGRWI